MVGETLALIGTAAAKGSVLLDCRLPRTLDRLVAEFGQIAWRGGKVELWVFEDAGPRAAAERALAAQGVAARVRSAYKPLVHAFLEDGLPPGAWHVGLPACDSARRFRLEAYPLAGLLGTDRLAFDGAGAPMSYTVGEREVFAPNRLRDGATVPCGWVRAWPAGAAAPSRDEAVETEFEAAFAAVMEAVADWSWGAEPPFFGTLAVDVAIGGIERALDWHDEVLSTREALHEDLYFSLLEFFQGHAGRRAGDRGLQPGQIVPEIVAAEGDAHVRVRLLPRRPAAAVADEPAPDLATLGRPLRAGEIAAAMAALGAEPFAHRSVQGRPIPGLYRRGAGPGLAITAGQHANETSGVVGALRAARTLVATTDTGFALVPQDNPDGYALHHRLRQANPRHMHHAARYTALGDDLEARTAEPLFEKAARLEAIRRSGARLHLNLHGYPAHEWTRPLTGYLPGGFEAWSIPKGFFLILRYHAGLVGHAVPFLHALTARLAVDPALAAFNAAQLAVWRAHAGRPDFPVLHGIPCMVAAADDQPTAFQLITEYPDETIYGAPFVLAHTTQMNTVLAAAELARAGMLG